ncbi:ABC transporter permease [bacterium]|nr:ABC transporter permease [bacterium]
MFDNYVKVALRNLRRNPMYASINILGLAIGIACATFVAIYAMNDISYDTFHAKADRIYRVVGVAESPNLGTYHNAVTPAPLVPAVLDDVPAIEQAFRLYNFNSTLCSAGEKRFIESGIVVCDPAVLKVLDIEFISGDKTTALAKPYSLIIDEETAKKYFGSEAAVGHTITLEHPGGTDVYEITAVMKNYPGNSSLVFSMLMPIPVGAQEPAYFASWNANALASYVLLQEGASREEVEKQVTATRRKHLQPDPTDKLYYYLQPFLDIHLYSGQLLYQPMNNNQGNINTLALFLAIGVFILVIAIINYVNLATARSLRRAKEVGIRKVLGSSRGRLITQFIIEAVILAFLGLFFSQIIVEALFPAFKSVMGGKILIDYRFEFFFLAGLLGITIVIGFLAGIYPAFVLSAYQAVETMKGTFATSLRGVLLRKGLVFLQFAIALMLVVCTGLVMKQMNYVYNKDLGFEKDQVLYLPIRNQAIRDKYPLLKSKLISEGYAVNVSAAGGIGLLSGSNGTVRVAGTDGQQSLTMRFTPVDYEIAETMGLTIVKGRVFQRGIASDTASGVVVNETAVKELGWGDPIGKQFDFGNETVSVIGVVKDFHGFSLYAKIEPMIMYASQSGVKFILVKLNSGGISDGVEAVRSVWERLLPSQPFDYGFVDQYFENNYRNASNTQNLFEVFALIAIFIGCLGLFGLASFTTEQKRKEIGVRKVLGASELSIVYKLSKETLILVLFSGLVAFPAAYYTMQQWLSNFAYRVMVGTDVFLLSGVLVLFIALGTVGLQAYRAASANPVNALRYE